MAETASLGDRYFALIDQIVQATLKGNIRSKEQVYQMLAEGVEGGTGELFERCLEERVGTARQQAENKADEMKQAKAARSLRALQTIQGEWQRWQQQNRSSQILSTGFQQITTALPEDRLPNLLRLLDPNQEQPLSLAQIQQLAKQLQQTQGVEQSPTPSDLAEGLLRGLRSWGQLENHLVSWIYDQAQGQIGFGGAPGQQGPWAAWGKQVTSEVPQSLFQSLALDRPPTDWVEQRDTLNAGDLAELAIVLRGLQQGLVNWFDKLIYDSKVGAKLSISTFLGFSVLWSQLANGFYQHPSRPGWTGLANGCFLVTLQILRSFAQQSYFPLYGGAFASFTGKYLRDALDYLDEPLRRAEGTQEKARILTLLGSSYRALGQIDRAIAFHQQALEIARLAGDRPCEIANLNHLSRAYVAQGNYDEAVNNSQRALILSRQSGDRPGEANALANFGYGEVLRAQQTEYAEPEVYEMAVNYLEQGLALSERQGDRQSQALCLSSLGIACLVLEKPEEAMVHLQRGIDAAQFTGDLYLQGINLNHLAEAHHQLQQTDQTIFAACLGMYLLEQIGATQWRQSAGLLVILQGRLGDEDFRALLQKQRPKLIAAIGIDGYDHLPQLLLRYREG